MPSGGSTITSSTRSHLAPEESRVHRRHLGPPPKKSQSLRRKGGDAGRTGGSSRRHSPTVFKSAYCLIAPALPGPGTVGITGESVISSHVPTNQSPDNESPATGRLSVSLDPKGGGDKRWVILRGRTSPIPPFYIAF